MYSIKDGWTPCMPIVVYSCTAEDPEWEVLERLSLKLLSKSKNDTEFCDVDDIFALAACRAKLTSPVPPKFGGGPCKYILVKRTRVWPPNMASSSAVTPCLLGVVIFEAGLRECACDPSWDCLNNPEAFLCKRTRISWRHVNNRYIMRSTEI